MKLSSFFDFFKEDTEEGSVRLIINDFTISYDTFGKQHYLTADLEFKTKQKKQFKRLCVGDVTFITERESGQCQIWDHIYTVPFSVNSIKIIKLHYPLFIGKKKKEVPKKMLFTVYTIDENNER